MFYYFDRNSMDIISNFKLLLPEAFSGEIMCNNTNYILYIPVAPLNPGNPNKPG